MAQVMRDSARFTGTVKVEDADKSDTHSFSVGEDGATKAEGRYGTLTLIPKRASIPIR